VKSANVTCFGWSVALISCLSWILYTCNLMCSSTTFWNVVLGILSYKLWWPTKFFGLFTHDCLTCSSFSLDVCGLPFDFSFLTLLNSSNWVNHQVTDLSVNAFVPYICRKLSCKITTDFNSAYHITYREYHHTTMHIDRNKTWRVLTYSNTNGMITCLGFTDILKNEIPEFFLQWTCIRKETYRMT
jgi:hypothetical protein